MAYITKQIVDANWVSKTQVYKVTWMQDTAWKMVDIETFDWEYTADELLDQVNKAKEQAIQSQNYIAEMESKFTTPPTQAELDALKVTQTNNAKLEAIKKQKSADINKLATLSDQLNLLAINLNLVLDEQIKTSPALATNPNVIQGKKVLSWIQTILTK